MLAAGADRNREDHKGITPEHSPSISSAYITLLHNTHGELQGSSICCCTSKALVCLELSIGFNLYLIRNL